MQTEFEINGYQFSLKQNKQGHWSLAQFSAPTLPTNESLDSYIDALTQIREEITKRNNQ